MKVYRLDFENGEYYTLTEKELHSDYTLEQLETFKNDDTTFFYETSFTVRQLNRARKLNSNEDYMYEFEEEYMICPDVYDILKKEYGGE